MKYGFSGSSTHRTKPQENAFIEYLRSIAPIEWHHGDCICWDELSHGYVRHYHPDCKIVIHPPTNPIKRAWCKGDEYRDEAPYLIRNKNIVNEVDHLVCCPASMTVQERGGTWHTYRYAKEFKRGITLILPNGEVKHENG